MIRRWVVVCVVLAASAPGAMAGISTRWRQNPIPQAAINDDPRLAIAASWSLLVDLTGTSLFNVGGLHLQITSSHAMFYNHVLGGDVPANPLVLSMFPSLEFDSYVSTTVGFAQAPSIPGRYIGPGAPLVGVDREFNAAWGATPNTGPLHGTGLEIARFTMVFDHFATAFYTVNGEVRSSDDPNTAVTFRFLGPIPIVPTTPEPTAAAGVLALAITAAVRRRAARSVDP